MSNDYMSITIGPINDTMNLVTKPGALWLSSFVFSHISKSLCLSIVKYVGNDGIISPFIPNENSDNYLSLINRDDGIGLFHDHIICRYNEDLWEDFPEIKGRVIIDIANIIGANEKDLKKYIMISACKITAEEGKNGIKASSVALDALELPKVFNPIEKTNPFIGCLANRKVKQIAEMFGINTDNWALVHKDNDGNIVFKNIEQIASNPSTKGFKKNNYYCILRADGDNMSSIINGLDSDEKCVAFSETCLKYCNDAAKAVNEYGGITIFAGGDDLFALVPLQNESQTICDLIQSIIEKFYDNFKNYIDSSEEKTAIPSLSFGAMICHCKHPLYEAVNVSTDLLYNLAKNKNNEKKNCTVFNLQKHSGQTENFLIVNSALADLGSMLSSVVLSKENDDSTKDGDKDAHLLSAAHKLILHQALIDSLTEEAAVKNTFVNVFDAEPHIGIYENFLHKELPNFYLKHCMGSDIVLLEKGKEKSDKRSKALAQVLRFIKFFVEKGEDEYADL